MYVLGLDVGTQGARALVCDANGEIVVRASQLFGFDIADQLPDGYVEQEPADWWEAASMCLRQAMDELEAAGIPAREIKAIAVDSTSGTIVPVDGSGAALRRAIMYNDTRSVAESDECNSAGEDFTDKLGYRFASSFSLPKILWIKQNEPHIFAQTAYFCHAADYITGMLTGSFGVSDTSNALKTGYDLVDGEWPSFIEELGIPFSTLPEVVSPGRTIGAVSSACAKETGLAAGTPVAAGVTDGTAGFFASGAAEVGDWNTTIGTTLVVRGVSRELIKDPQGRIYCHAHPEGCWLPGGASNTGAGCLVRLFEGRNLDELNVYVPQYSPTSMLVYPLPSPGERLPFVNPNARGFIIGEPRDSRDLYTAHLEGVGFVERWVLELMEELGAPVGDTVYTTGGGARSVEWMQVRANIMGRRVIRPLHADCAMGTAIVAASKSLYSDIGSAVEAMVKPGEAVEPDPVKSKAYPERYQAFRKTCSSRGYE